MFEVGDLVCENRHPEKQGYICEVLKGKESKHVYLEVRWLNFPWGNPHTRTLEVPQHITILAKGSKSEK